MWDCFLTGAPKDGSGRRALKVVHSVEYLRYDLWRRRVGVWGDFFVKNMSKEEACLRGLHRGNIKFKLRSEGWVTDKQWTGVLRKIAGEYIDLEVSRGGKIWLCQAGAEALEVSLLQGSGSMKRWSPEPPSGDAFACFSGWESPAIEPGRCVVFRIAGTIYGKTYDRLMSGHEGNLIEIMGGEPLADVIRGDLRREVESGTEFETEYWEFIKEWIERPSFYHVFFEFTGGRKVKSIETSDDMKEKRVNLEFDDRYITWCCSDMDFNIFAKANGPVLMVATDEGDQRRVGTRSEKLGVG